MRPNSRNLLLLAAMLALPAAAQTVTGTILGVVTDPSGAVVPRATTVTTTNQAADPPKATAKEITGLPSSRSAPIA
jgi:hypothetical protein